MLIIRCVVYNSTPLKPGMTVSNGMLPFPLFHAQIYQKAAELGYHSDWEYGIRIEHVVVVREGRARNNFGDKGILGFDHVTMLTASPAPPVIRHRTDMGF